MVTLILDFFFWPVEDVFVCSLSHSYLKVLFGPIKRKERKKLTTEVIFDDPQTNMMINHSPKQFLSP